MAKQDWLTKDERRVLAGYYHNLREYGAKMTLSESSVAPSLNRWSLWPGAKRLVNRRMTPYGKSEPQTNLTFEQIKRAIPTAAKNLTRVELADNLLEARGLISLSRHQTEHGLVTVKLTLDGFDLGRKYDCWWTMTGLWFQEYRNHWILMIVSFLGGVLGSLFVASLTHPK